MPKRKRIRCITWNPIAVAPAYKVPWTDVYCFWKGKPKRTFSSAPCLVCKAELLVDLEQARARQAKHPDWGYDREVHRCAAMLSALETAPYAHDDAECPNVYTHANGIDRAQAERMLQWFLQTKYGLRNVQCLWDKPKLVVSPTGFGDYSEPVLTFGELKQKLGFEEETDGQAFSSAPRAEVF